MCSGQLTPPCPKPICGLATLASLSERGGVHFHTNHWYSQQFLFRTRTWKTKRMDTKLSTNMNATVSTDSAAAGKRKGPSKPKGKNASKGSGQPCGAKPSERCVEEPPAPSEMSITQ